MERNTASARTALDVGLDDKYRLEHGRIYLSGIQALVRLPLMQAARDAAAGLDTAGFISGYRGSPLAGLDQQFERVGRILDEHRIRFQAGLNEELAATAVWGSQQVGLHEGARHDGVFGMWYGKAPGVDRACDALRHANAAGSAPYGGVLAIAGDDHACKSSSYPSQSEFAMMHLEIPVLSPASIQDVIDYGLYGWALSRYAGCWVSLIAPAHIMDSSGVIEVGPERAAIRLPRDLRPPPGSVHIRLRDDPKEQERRVRELKLPAAIAFARHNGLNHAVFDSDAPRLVIVATGKAYADTRQALADLGIDAGRARALNIRLVKVGMPWPLDPVSMRALCAGSETVLVVEEKRPLVESQLKEILYPLPEGERPNILGKRDERGQRLLADTLDLDAREIARAIAYQLPAESLLESVDDHLAALAASDACQAPEPSDVRRIPYFCSGCPHNRSTALPEGSRALVGIGCHYMVQWMDRDSDHFSQMGGEGVAWLGQQGFTDEPHVFANLGDGTYFHSGVLAIRAAVAAGARITYKLLYNHAVAMTGGQSIDDVLDVPRITRQLAAEGVAEIVLVAEEPERYAGDSGLAPGVRVEPRARLDAVQRELREVEGVTVLVYDQGCAAEKRRQRKRGLLEDPPERVFINEAVCEGCGDCSTASNCLSVEPVETELGTKRRINQSSCNKDMTCLEGACPALVRIRGGALRAGIPASVRGAMQALPEPRSRCDRASVYNIVFTGIGGTGVTTVAALLGMAAHLEGRASGVLDMTGLAQKGGAVVSHVRLADAPDAIHGTRVPRHAADLLLGGDAVVAAGESVLGELDRGRTHSVMNSHFIPTAASVGRHRGPLDTGDLLARVSQTSAELSRVDASELARAALGDAIGSNLILLGHAFQLGLVPLRLDSLLRAIELNGVALEMNRDAFTLGRLSAHDPKAADVVLPAPPPAAPEDWSELVARRSRDLALYQDAAYADRYRALVERVRVAEEAASPGSRRLTITAARGAYKLMAYKDEYEVARLYTDGRFHERLAAEFAGDYRVELQLAPPLFARRDPESGRLRKRAYGPWMLAAMGMLARMKRLRGTRLDPFGYLPERRLERRLVAEYETCVSEIVAALTPERFEPACRMLAFPDEIQGFDHIKHASVEAARRERDSRMAAFRAMGDGGAE